MKTPFKTQLQRRNCRRHEKRGGYTTPAIAFALLVAMAGFALLIDRMWLDAADMELTVAAESAALAAAAELAADDMLSQNPDPEMRVAHATTAAAMVAGQNLVAGAPLVLDTNPQRDLRFGYLALNSRSNRVQFVEAEDAATTVLITAKRTRQSSNPIALFLSGLTGVASGDVATRVEATVDNRIIGVRPPDNAAAPALPLAIWYVDPTGQRTDTWYNQIENRGGQDLYGFDSNSNQVTNGPDGIPEIVLHSQVKGQKISSINVCAINLGAGLNDEIVSRQIVNGWTARDLSSLGGEFLLPAGTTQSLPACGALTESDQNSLNSMIGQARICLLYSSIISGAQSISGGDAICTGFVAIRIMSTSSAGGGGCQIVAQPCVVKTRSAMLNQMVPYYMSVMSAATSEAADSTSTNSDEPESPPIQNKSQPAPPNPYIYSIRLTH